MPTTHRDTSREPRREKLQFPIEREVHYQCTRGARVWAAGIGRSFQISSHEVQFTTQHPLKRGEKVHVTLDWPVMLDNTCHLKLEIRGPVIRSGPGTASVKIMRREFRTRGLALRVVGSRAG